MAQFKQALGLPSTIALVMGSMIGSGIFIVSADMSRHLQSPGLLMVAWIITGVLTVVGALSLAELAAMMPKAGGQYVFLREALGPLWGFLFGWTLFLVIQTGTVAAVAVAFGKFLGVFFPAISAKNWLWHMAHFNQVDVGLNTQNGVAILVLAFLTIVNIFGVKNGAIIQIVMTVAKVAALIGLIIAAVMWGFNPTAWDANFSNFWNNFNFDTQFSIGDSVAGIFVVLAVVQVGSLFSADAWNNVTFTAAEVKNPKRNLPLALLIGTSGVIGLYLLANLAYLVALPLPEISHAPEDRVATAVLQQILGTSGAKWMAFAILISTFGCVNGMVMAGARVYYAMSEDGLFFKKVSQIHPVYKTPIVSLAVQGVWACVLCLSGSYGQLLDYVIFAQLMFYILTISSVFILRRKKPKAERPYKVWGYPVLPALYIVMALWIELVLLIYKPQYTWPGLLIVCTGIPVYWAWSKDLPKTRQTF
jgi:APA family basic amino acid/polyamine antiporter